jgi:uncharacterized protein (TIGR02145 family)
MKNRKQTFRIKLLRFSLMRGLLLFRGAGVCFLLLLSGIGFAQNVGINTTGIAPNTKALLDLNANAATKSGLLVPRMTTTERSTITAPIPMSLLIFNTTTDCFEAWNQTSLTWVAFGCIGCAAPTGVAALAGANPICVGSTLTLTGSATGATSWAWTGPNGFTSTLQNPTIAGITTAGAGVYTLIASNTCGSATAVNTASVTVNAVPSVAAAGSDQTLACGLTSATLAGNVPVTGTGLWSVVSGTATITAPTSASSGVTGLVAAGNVTLRWTISNSPCTPSTDDVVITTCALAAFPCGGTVTAIVDVTSSTGNIWMDRNLGASQVATSSTDAAAYGDLYQWGRCSDGHEDRGSAVTTTNSSTDTPGHGSFITESAASPYDWRIPQNNSLWQGVAGINNPCPTGYRIPTSAEFDLERTTDFTSNNSAGAFGGTLKLTVAGVRSYNNAALGSAGGNGYYWCSTTNSAYSYFLTIGSGSSVSFVFRAYGFSVRCIKD